MFHKKRISDSFDTHKIQLFEEIEQLRIFIALQRAKNVEHEVISKLMFDLRSQCAKLNALIEISHTEEATAFH